MGNSNTRSGSRRRTRGSQRNPSRRDEHDDLDVSMRDGAHGGGGQSKTGVRSGKVKWFNDTKGFGFISQDGGGADIFVHYTAIQMGGFRKLKEGQRVTYEIGDGPKGPQAENVSVSEN